MENDDEWFAVDKLEHLLVCFFIALALSSLLSRSRYSFVRGRSLSLASIVSLTVGAAKEAADEIGLFRSSGASIKDAAADAVGVLIAIPFSIYISKLRFSSAKDVRDQDQISMV